MRDVGSRGATGARLRTQRRPGLPDRRLWSVYSAVMNRVRINKDYLRTRHTWRECAFVFAGVGVAGSSNRDLDARLGCGPGASLGPVWLGALAWTFLATTCAHALWRGVRFEANGRRSGNTRRPAWTRTHERLRHRRPALYAYRWRADPTFQLSARATPTIRPQLYGARWFTDPALGPPCPVNVRLPLVFRLGAPLTARPSPDLTGAAVILRPPAPRPRPARRSWPSRRACRPTTLLTDRHAVRLACSRNGRSCSAATAARPSLTPSRVAPARVSRPALRAASSSSTAPRPASAPLRRRRPGRGAPANAARSRTPSAQPPCAVSGLPGRASRRSRPVPPHTQPFRQQTPDPARPAPGTARR